MPVLSFNQAQTCALTVDEDVHLMLFLLAESVASRMRELAMRCRVVEVSVRDADLFSFTRQHKLPTPTCSSHEIANVAFDLFKRNYCWRNPIRSIGVRGSELVDVSAGTQFSFMQDDIRRDKWERIDAAVPELRGTNGSHIPVPKKNLKLWGGVAAGGLIVLVLVGFLVIKFMNPSDNSPGSMATEQAGANQQNREEADNMPESPSAGLSVPEPTAAPASEPAAIPTSDPAPEQTPEPTPTPTPAPTSAPSPTPTTAPEPTPTLTPTAMPKEELTVLASYTDAAFADVDAIIYATTSIRATKVTLACSAGDKYYGTWDMETIDYINWMFYADFYETGTFTITITACDSSGDTASTTLTIIYGG